MDSVKLSNNDFLTALQTLTKPAIVGKSVDEKEAALIANDSGTWASVYGFKKPRDEHIAIHLLNGMSRYGIARTLDLSPATVYNLVKSADFTVAFHRMQTENREELTEQSDRIAILASQGLNRLADIIFNSDDADLVQKTSLALVDRAGHAVRTKVDKAITITIDREAGDCLEAAFSEFETVNALEVPHHQPVKKLLMGVNEQLVSGAV